MHHAKFYKCKTCGNIVLKVVDKGPELSCCGAVMGELKANTSDGAAEKHVPAVVQSGDKVTVTVGSVMHPMEEKHFIEWIYLVTDNGIQCSDLKPGQEPVAEFLLNGAKLVSVYEFCNLHGLWKVDL